MKEFSCHSGVFLSVLAALTLLFAPLASSLSASSSAVGFELCQMQSLFSVEGKEDQTVRKKDPENKNSQDIAYKPCVFCFVRTLLVIPLLFVFIAFLIVSFVSLVISFYLPRTVDRVPPAVAPNSPRPPPGGFSIPL